MSEAADEMRLNTEAADLRRLTVRAFSNRWTGYRKAYEKRLKMLVQMGLPRLI